MISKSKQLIAAILSEGAIVELSVGRTRSCALSDQSPAICEFFAATKRLRTARYGKSPHD